jgi:hypothetical protein
MQPSTPWPWSDLEPSDFRVRSDFGLERVVTRAQAFAVLDLGIDQDLVATGPDGKNYLIRIRPLLPDEIV